MLTNADLMAIFNFTEDDLEANRAGRMIARQVEHLKKQINNGMGCAASLIVSFACIGLVAGMAEHAGQPLPRKGSKDTPGLTLVIWGVFIALAVGATLFWRSKAQTEIQQGTVAWEEGTITLKMIPTRVGFSYTMQINSKELPISSYRYGVLTDKHRVALEMNSFRLYFAPASKKVLSLESLEAPES